MQRSHKIEGFFEPKLAVIPHAIHTMSDMATDPDRRRTPPGVMKIPDPIMVPTIIPIPLSKPRSLRRVRFSSEEEVEAAILGPEKE